MSHEEKTIVTDVPLAQRPKAPAPPRPPAGEEGLASLVAPPPSIGSFYAEGRSLVDARKAHLQRMGILPEHAAALAMPDLGEKPLLPPLRTEQLPAEVPEDYEPKKLRKGGDAVLEA